MKWRKYIVRKTRLVLWMVVVFVAAAMAVPAMADDSQRSAGASRWEAVANEVCIVIKPTGCTGVKDGMMAVVRDFGSFAGRQVRQIQSSATSSSERVSPAANTRRVHQAYRRQ